MSCSHFRSFIRLRTHLGHLTVHTLFDISPDLLQIYTLSSLTSRGPYTASLAQTSWSIGWKRYVTSPDQATADRADDVFSAIFSSKIAYEHATQCFRACSNHRAPAGSGGRRPLHQMVDSSWHFCGPQAQTLSGTHEFLIRPSEPRAKFCPGACLASSQRGEILSGSIPPSHRDKRGSLYDMRPQRKHLLCGFAPYKPLDSYGRLIIPKRKCNRRP